MSGMKSKLFNITVISLAIGIMVLCHVQYGIFSRYNYFTAQWDKIHHHIRFLAYGEHLVTSAQQEKVAAKMGFTVYTMAGCVVSSAEMRGADRYNKVMINALNTSLGKGWQTKFDKSVDSLFRLQSGQRLYDAVLNQPEVEELLPKKILLKVDSIYIKVNPNEKDVNRPNAWLCIQKKNKVSIIWYYRVNPYNLGVVKVMY